MFHPLFFDPFFSPFSFRATAVLAFTWLGVRFGDRIPVRARFSARAHPASHRMGTGSLFPEAKRPGCSVYHPPTFSAEVHLRVEPFSLFFLLAFMAYFCMNVIATFTFTWLGVRCKKKTTVPYLCDSIAFQAVCRCKQIKYGTFACLLLVATADNEQWVAVHLCIAERHVADGVEKGRFWRLFRTQEVSFAICHCISFLQQESFNFGNPPQFLFNEYGLLVGLCGLVVRVSGYRYRGLGFDSRRYQIFWVVVGLERGPFSLVRSNWGATWIKSSGSGPENRD